MKKILVLVAVCAMAACGLPQVLAADTPIMPATPDKKADPVKPAKPSKPRTLSVHGLVKTVDQTAKTFTLGEHTYAVTSETKIFKAEKPAVFEDLKIGDNASLSYKKIAADKLEVIKLNIGKAAGDPKPKK